MSMGFPKTSSPAEMKISPIKIKVIAKGKAKMKTRRLIMQKSPGISDLQCHKKR